jgi:hypothetical protein
MTTEENWNALKEHAKKQEDKAAKLPGRVGGIVKHVWKDVQNKMWSIENGKK